MSRQVSILVALLLSATATPLPAGAACEDLAGTRYYADCANQARERDARALEAARREEQRLGDAERRQQAIDERVRQLEREQRLDEMRRRLPELH